MISIDNNKLIQLWDSGMPIADIVTSFGCNASVIRNRLRKLNIRCDRSAIMSRKYNNIHTRMWPDVKALLDKGLSVHQITQDLHISCEAINKLISDNNYDYNYQAPLITDDEDYKNQLIELRKTHTVPEIAKIVGKPLSSVQRHLGLFGLTTAVDRVDISDNDVLNDWNSGMSINQIALKYDCSHDTITKRLQKYNITSERKFGIERHFDLVHESDWDSIKAELDKCIPVSVIATNHNIRYEAVYRMIESKHYKCKGLQDLDEKQLANRIANANDNIEYLLAIKNYYSEYDNLPVLYTLSRYMDKDIDEVRVAVTKYNLYPFLGNKGPSVKVLRVLRDLSDLGIKYEENNRTILKTDLDSFMEIDVYLPDYKLGIEINPTWTHSIDSINSEKIDKFYHQTKSLLAEKYGIGLIHLYDSDFIDERRYQVFLTQMKALISDKQKFGARKCKVQIIDRKLSNDFLNTYHFQGGEHNSNLLYGLFYDETLLGVLTIGKSRYTDNSYEIIRYCMNPYYIVIGGFDKLFNAFLHDVGNVNNVVSYMDLNKRLRANNVYDNHDFVFEKLTTPDYVWINQSGTDVKSRYSVTKAELIKQGYDKNLSETEIMLSRHYYRIFGAGSKRYVWKG